ncbi:D-alanyl-D-alanine carboxypeptidase/D-alanyl-D-alanine-endopeptidase [Myxacorys almedinensis]|uniref:D-alanyl-D-alanine carboxypeptidase/D-alanyl-D-alanine-endopeptidase n=1 Tax=Myxacorys almedinensis A TaxID=2690445 RepID=A0A8J7Z1Y0_9CYAN|nr:D-alanyl-D-alanine carboxypeptidase/D-alanyl-D-alanine-endopeptidase [Myxacorys almedinensis]NDJ16658.1 D-alanyl-D-alanine carboxypeptidase/D-alanyl-D-alanine-endopeptidase [Myxacorys almedinensis A]
MNPTCPTSLFRPAFITILAVTAVVSSLGPVRAQSTAGTICPAQLGGAIDRAIARVPGAKWSVLVQTQGATGARSNVYRRNFSTLLVPASNNKILTTAAALKKLGAQHRITTPVFGNSAGPDLATLRVIGQGDPSLKTAQLNALAQQLRQRGIRQTNLLIGDDTVFQGEPYNPFWSNRHRGLGYAPPVNSLMLNENIIYNGAVPNAGNYFVGEFRKALTKAGIKIAASTLVKRTPAPAGEVALASVTSPPLSSLIFETNQASNNVYAETLLKTLGRLQNPNSLDTNTSGVATVKSILTEMGVNPNRYTMVDGSGLADRNLASAEAFVQTLQAIALMPEAQIYRRSLPVAGVSGTLSNRFRNTPAQGIVAAKTGTISGVVSLSGYVSPRNYSPLVFSVLVNSGASASTVRSAVDEAVISMARLRKC